MQFTISGLCVTCVCCSPQTNSWEFFFCYTVQLRYLYQDFNLLKLRWKWHKNQMCWFVFRCIIDVAIAADFFFSLSVSLSLSLKSVVIYLKHIYLWNKNTAQQQQKTGCCCCCCNKPKGNESHRSNYAHENITIQLLSCFLY